MRSGDVATAVLEFRKVVTDAPRFAEGYLNLAIAEHQAGDIVAARNAAQKAAELSPGLRGAHFILGLACYEQDSLKEAEAAFHEETRIDPKSAAAWMWTGVAALAAEKSQDALTALLRARELKPNDVDVLYHLGRAYILLSKESYDTMYRLDPDSARVHETLAQANAEAGKTEDAINEYKLAISKAPNQPGLREELADELWRSNALDDAEQQYTEALRLTPSDAVLLYKKGSLEVSRQKAALGLPLLQRALQLDATLKEAYFQIGLGQSQLQNDAEALVNLQRATEVDPNSEDQESAYYHIFLIHRRRGEREDAAKALTEFQRVKAKNAADRQSRITAKRQRIMLPVRPPELADASAAN